MFDFSIVTNWIHQTLTSVMPEGLAIFLECVVIGVCIILMYAVLAIILIYMERKICAFFQCRLGPNRVGKWGSIQVICDVLKMLTKEIFTPKDADRFLYNLAPFMVIIASFLTFACLPINKGMEVLNFNVGVFFLLAASSIGVLGILLAHRYILHPGCFVGRCARYPFGGLVVKQQVHPHRRDAKRSTDYLV